MKKLALFAIVVLLVSVIPSGFWIAFAIGILWSYVGYLGVKILETTDRVPLPLVLMLSTSGPIAFFSACLAVGTTHETYMIKRVICNEFPFLKKIKLQSPIVFNKNNE